MSEGLESLQFSLTTAIIDTMEQMTFEEVEIIGRQVNSEGQPNHHLWAVVPVEQPVSGEVTLEISSISAHRLTENVYGAKETDELQETTVKDALAEILHTIAGRFMDNLVSEDQKFELGLPMAGVGDQPPSAPKIVSVKANVGGHYLTASIGGQGFSEYLPSDTG